MLDFWMDFPWWIRLLVGMAFMAVGGLMAWYISMRLGIVPFAIGFAMLIFGGKDDSEKNGYHF